MKRVEKIPAGPVADAFHLSQSKSECKNAAFFVEVSQIGLSLSPRRCSWRQGRGCPQLPPDLPCWLGGPPESLGLPYREPPARISPDSLLALVPMLVMEKIYPSSFLNTMYMLGMEKEMCLVVGVR